MEKTDFVVDCIDPICINLGRIGGWVIWKPIRRQLTPVCDQPFQATNPCMRSTLSGN